MEDLTYDLSLLEGSRAKWEKSSGLRLVYRSIFAEIMDAAGEGEVLDIGAGAGFLKIDYPGVTASDVVKTPFVDCAVSAYEIEHIGQLWDAIVAMDVLHHLTDPTRFFRSAAASLKPGGRVVLVEPAATPFGRTFYRLCHQEPCVPDRLRAPYIFEADGDEGSFANMGMGWALFQRDRDAVEGVLAGMNLRMIAVRYRDLLAYPATGGLSRSQLLPTGVLRFLLEVEGRLPQWLLRCLALRMIIVLERAGR